MCMSGIFRLKHSYATHTVRDALRGSKTGLMFSRRDSVSQTDLSAPCTRLSGS